MESTKFTKKTPVYFTFEDKVKIRGAIVGYLGYSPVFRADKSTRYLHNGAGFKSDIKPFKRCKIPLLGNRLWYINDISGHFSQLTLIEKKNG